MSPKFNLLSKRKNHSYQTLLSVVRHLKNQVEVGLKAFKEKYFPINHLQYILAI
jgi:hypothetical protein